MSRRVKGREGIIQKTIRGRVKWFSTAKGYGFVASDEPGPDVMLHINVLREFGRTSILDGSIVEMAVRDSQRGRQAVEVISIEPPDPSNGVYDAGEQKVTPVSVEEAYEPARVKWFDKMRGFGFVNTFRSVEDVFLHIEVLRQSSLTDIQTGEAVAVRIQSGSRGKVVAEIVPWESVM